MVLDAFSRTSTLGQPSPKAMKLLMKLQMQLQGQRAPCSSSTRFIEYWCHIGSRLTNYSHFCRTAVDICWYACALLFEKAAVLCTGWLLCYWCFVQLCNLDCSPPCCAAEEFPTSCKMFSLHRERYNRIICVSWLCMAGMGELLYQNRWSLCKKNKTKTKISAKPFISRGDSITSS